MTTRGAIDSTFTKHLSHIDDVDDPYGAPVRLEASGSHDLMSFIWLATSYDDEGRIYGYCVNTTNPEYSEYGTIWAEELKASAFIINCTPSMSGDYSMPMEQAITKHTDRAQAQQHALSLNQTNPCPPKGTRGKRFGDWLVYFDRSYRGQWSVKYAGKK